MYFYGKSGLNLPSKSLNNVAIIGSDNGFMGSIISFDNFLYCKSSSASCNPSIPNFFPSLAAFDGL